MNKTIYNRDGTFAYRIHRMEQGLYYVVVSTLRIDVEAYLFSLRLRYEIQECMPDMDTHLCFRLWISCIAFTERRDSLVPDLSFLYCSALHEMKGKFVPSKYFFG